MTSFLHGSYFEGVSLWYSDTYPMRDKLVAADQ
ncbi:DHHW family protein [Coprococcus eutactus]|nr:DHHW family protein [Coprococcus eutactus]